MKLREVSLALGGWWCVVLLFAITGGTVWMCVNAALARHPPLGTPLLEQIDLPKLALDLQKGLLIAAPLLFMLGLHVIRFWRRLVDATGRRLGKATLWRMGGVALVSAIAAVCILGSIAWGLLWYMEWPQHAWWHFAGAVVVLAMGLGVLHWATVMHGKVQSLLCLWRRQTLGRTLTFKAMASAIDVSADRPLHGRRVADLPPIPIKHELKCPTCDYNLQSLSGPVVTCPECGLRDNLHVLAEAQGWGLKNRGPIGVIKLLAYSGAWAMLAGPVMLLWVIAVVLNTQDLVILLAWCLSAGIALTPWLLLAMLLAMQTGWRAAALPLAAAPFVQAHHFFFAFINYVILYACIAYLFAQGFSLGLLGVLLLVASVVLLMPAIKRLDLWADRRIVRAAKAKRKAEKAAAMAKANGGRPAAT